MLNLTENDLHLTEKLLQRMSTEDIMEDLMYMYYAYVKDAMNPEEGVFEHKLAEDLQNKLFTIQTVLQIVMAINKPFFTVTKGDGPCS